MRGVPGITRWSKMADEAAASISEFMQIEFAEQYGARRFEPAYDFGIGGRNKIFQHSAGCCCSDACGLSQVLHRQWNTVQRSLPFAAHDFRFSRSRLVQR